MNKTYHPDNWVLLEITDNDEVRYKVLAGWDGGYLGDDYWRISSGVTDIQLEDGVCLIYNESGSVYNCHKDCMRLNRLMGQIYDDVFKACIGIDMTVSIVVDVGNVEVN